ncbi:FtsX-like permease family protein [Ornithinimicrobium sp. Y1694]|uniref:FtsX-like permease family protein n=1 Tax=Ornithinimicrobium sp. Y1694 TaxID=3418590 RepID=UPI003CFAAEE7
MTTWLGWALRRAQASTGLLLTLLALVTATTAILAGAVGYSDAAATTAARQAITGAVPNEAGIRIQTRQAEDPAAQDSAATRIIQDAFAPAPVSVQRTVVSEPRQASSEDGTLEGRLVVISSPSLVADAEGIDERVELVDGSWPAATTSPDTDPVPAMLHTGAAQAWEVEVGDTLTVAGVEVTLAATWRPVDPEDAYWFGDRLAIAGRTTDGSERGPLIVAPGTVGRFVDTPLMRWTVQPDASRIQPGDLAHLASAAETLREDLRVDTVNVRGVVADGDLAPTATAAATNLATASALGVIPLSVLVLVTMLAVVQLARLLATTREAQAGLLVARGATRTQVLVSTILEAAVVTVLGTALGALLAWGVLQFVPAGDAQGPTILRVAVLTGIGLLIVLSAVAILQVRRLSAAGQVTELSGRTRAATALATLILVIGAAAIAYWQLRRSGSPLVTAPDGTLGTDLVAGAAPALLLAAAAVVAMALLGPASRLIETLSRPTRAAAGHLAAAQVSRRLTVYAVPAVLTVLAVGATTVAGLYAGTSARLRDDLAAIAQGAPIKADLIPPVATTEPGLVTPPPMTLADVPGIDRVSPVWVDENGRIADLQLPVTMSPVAQLAEVAGGTDLVPVDALALPEAEAGSTGIAIPPGTRTVEITLDADLTISQETLQSLQDSFDSYVAELTGESTEEDPQHVYVGDPIDREMAEEVARSWIDSELERDAQEHTRRWEVEATFWDPASAQSSVTRSTRIEMDIPYVTVPEGAPYTDGEIVPGGGSGTVTFTLPEGTEQHLQDLRLRIPTLPDNRFTLAQPDLSLAITARADDGTELLTGTQDWGSLEAATPDVVAEREAVAAEEEEPWVEHHPDGSMTMFSGTYVPAELDTSTSTWSLTGPSANVGNEVTVAPGLTWIDQSSRPGDNPFPSARSAREIVVPVALTTQAAGAADLAVGDEAQIRAFGTQVRVEVAAVVPAIPGSLAPSAALVDRNAMALALAESDRALPYPQQIWATPQPDQADTAVGEIAGIRGVSSVTGPGSVTITDATSAARLVFWVASAGAVLLAATGIAAVAATLLAGRRPEVAVLRALGMPPRAQGRSRALELGGVVVAAVLLGLAAGWAVSAGVVPALARSTTARDQIALDVPLLLEVGPWAALLGAGGLAVAAVLLVQAGRVRHQALDNDYREEIR